MPFRLRKPLKWLLGSLAALTVIIGLLFGAFGFVVGRVPEYRVQLQDWISERSGLAVEFRTLSARLRLYGPELVFNDAVVRTPDRTRVLATAHRGSVGFDLWNSIRTGRLTAGRFSLEGPQIGLIRTREGRIQLLGQSALPERGDARPFAIEQLPTGRFHVERAVVTFRDEITGRGPWSLSGVNFDLDRDPALLRLRGDASLPPGLGRELDFSATVQGALEESAALVSTFSVEGKALDLAGWADVFPDEWPAPETGRGSLRVQGALRGSRLTEVSAKVDVANVAAALPPWTTPLPVALPMHHPGGDEADDDDEDEARADDAQATVAQTPDALTGDAPDESGPAAAAAPPAHPGVLSYDRVAFALRARRLDDEWRLSLSNLELAGPQSSWRAAQIDAHWARNAEGRVKAGIKADRVALENLWPLLAYLPESPDLARLRALDASGTIEDLDVEYERAATAAAPAYQVRARIDDLAFRPIGKVPGLTGLSGHLHATAQGGQMQLAARDARFELPWIFDDALSVQSVDGTIAWQRADAGWTVGSDEVRIVGEDGRAVARFDAMIPHDGSPLLDLSARGQDLEVSATHKYVPAGKLRQKTVEWFDRAFVDGRVATAELIYKGPTRAFPFRHDEGTFLARGHVEGAVFDYHAGWAPASAVTADVEFHNEGMQIRSSDARVGQLHVSDATAAIADLKQAHLVIKAAANGDLQDGLQFLKGSPIGPRLGEQFARLSGHGAIDAKVKLDLPIRHLEDRDIEVTARFADAGVAMQGLDAPVRNLGGSLTVHNTLLAAADLHGLWLGGTLDVSVRPEGPSGSVLNAQGHASAAQLQPLLQWPATIKLSGATDWHLATRLGTTPGPIPGDRGADQAGDRTVRIDSDLQGFGIGLPKPLGKSEAETRPLQLALQFEGEDTLTARGSLGEVRSLVRLRHSAQGWTLDRGGVRADGIAPALPDHRGLRIEGAIDRFALDEWLALRAPQGGGRPLSDYLQAANVRIGDFELYGYRWPDVRGILQATPAGWRVDVSGPNGAGQILIPENFDGAQPLSATLERLVIQKSEEPATPSRTVRDPRSLPNLQVYVADLRLGTRALGAVDLRASRVPQGIRFDSASVIGESVRGQGHGEWLVTADGQHSSLNATVTSTDIAATLRALDYPEFIEGKQGEIRADLSWPGGFNGNILEHASGAISVHAEAGQLVNLQPGAGRVLGLFSIAALPRRLALDFSDLTEKGLAFDRVHGDFELRDGNAYTSNLLLRGPAAEIGIAGRTGLSARDYDQTAVVTGNLGASLPVAGALAGGPAVGAALLLFSQVFKEPLKGMTRGYYRITGSWDDPVVERVDASEAKADAGQEK